nr:hypothetical protein [Novosphingobium sp. THN1]
MIRPPQLPHYTRAHPHHVEADRRQCRAQHAVVLVAPAPAPPFDQLGKGRIRIGRQPAAKLHVDVLERNRLNVRPNERVECRQVGRHRRRQADPRQVGRKLRRRERFNRHS